MRLGHNIHDIDDIWQVNNDLLGSNTYVCILGGYKNCIIIDPGSDTGAVEIILGDLDLKPQSIFCTHGHFDHIAGAYFFQEKYNAPVHLPALDVDIAEKSNFMLMAFKYDKRITVPKFHVKVSDQYQTTVADTRISYFACPGHTAGSSVIQIGGALFTGDTLYARGVALSKLPGADSDQLRQSITSIFNRFDDQNLVLPGHGEVALLSDIKIHNEKLREFLGNSRSLKKLERL